MKKRACVLVILSALLWQGCSLKRPVAKHALAYNKGVEKAHNQVLFLNIVRSMERRPKHFSAITQVRGKAEVSLTSTLGFSFGGDAEDDYPVELGAGLSKGTSTIDVAVLDSEGFVRGIMNPVTLELLDYYWTQGWDKELTLMLAVREIRIGNDSYTNVPTADFARVKDFQNKVRSLIQYMRIKKVRYYVGPPIAKKDVKSLGQLIVNAASAELEIEESDNHYRLYQARHSRELWLELEGQEKTILRDALETSEAVSESTGTLFFRSPEGIIHYLGQLMRYQQAHLEAEGIYFPTLAGPEAVLFFAREVASQREARRHLSVSYQGKTYVIPRLARGDRSMRCLSFVSQLIGLHKSRDDLPTTGAVTAIN